jgi:CRP-like cAMP-binding protein
MPSALAPYGKEQMPPASQRNLVLSRLSAPDFQLLEPYLEDSDLPLRKVLERRGKPIRFVYFPESGFASVVADGGKQPIEVGIIGREGMTGLPVILGSDRNSNEVYIQAAGQGRCVRANDLRKVIDKSVSLHRSLLRYAHTFLEQATRTAVANGRSKIEERLARWLLMADDRIDGPDLPLTHEFLAMMLGVRRAGVTMALQELEREGLIARKRGHVVIVDRRALEKLSNGTYVSLDG